MLDPVTVTNIVGNYTQGGGGTTVLDVFGTGTGCLSTPSASTCVPTVGQLDVSGNVDLSGTLDIDFTHFQPPTGTVLDILNYSGSFSESGLVVDLIGCGTCNLSPLFGASNGEFKVTVMHTPAEPETLVLLAISLIAMAVFVGRMRHSILPDLKI